MTEASVLKAYVHTVIRDFAIKLDERAVRERDYLDERLAKAEAEILHQALWAAVLASTIVAIAVTLIAAIVLARL